MNLIRKMIFDLAMQGDASARAIFERVGKALGTVIADLVNIFNFPMYVVGGGVASAWDAFAPSMLETIGRNSFVYRNTAPYEMRLPAPLAAPALRARCSAAMPG